MPQTVAAARLQRFSDALSFTKSSVINCLFRSHNQIAYSLTEPGEVLEQCRERILCPSRNGQNHTVEGQYAERSEAFR